MELREPAYYTEERLEEMDDADLDLLINEIGGRDEGESSGYSRVLERAVQLIEGRRER